MVESKKERGVFRIEVDANELRNLFQTLNALDKESQNEIRDRAFPLSQRLAGQLFQFAGSAPAPQTALVAQSITPKRDRLVRVDVGGSKKVGRKWGGETSKSGKGKVRQDQAPAGALLWGTEYGDHAGVDAIGRNYTSRFKASRNPRGYWITPAVDFYAPILAIEYSVIIQDVAGRLRLT